MTNDIRQLVKEVLDQGYLMSLATTDNGGVWVCDVIYIHDDDLNIYWMSDKNARHSQAIKKDNKVAGSITYSTKSKVPNFGIQFEGAAEQLEGIQFMLLIKHLAKRSYPAPDISQATKLMDGDVWYKLTPKKIGLIDEENFGYDRQNIEI